jgi:hypothetical protein
MEVGSKVKLVKRGKIGWEIADYTSEEYADLSEGIEYTISKTDIEHEYPSVCVDSDWLQFDIHPDHFEIIKNK